jgi:hypothetical protein
MGKKNSNKLKGIKMEIHMDKLLQIIGELTVENKLYQQRVQDMAAENNLMTKEIEELKNKLNEE